jgi:predicted RNA binding protein YcfA (HicA-like mRNA interferase family)
MSDYHRELQKICDDRGWKMGLTNGDHIKLTHPDIPDQVICSNTPSRPHRAIRNTLGLIQRYERQFGVGYKNLGNHKKQKGSASQPFAMSFDESGSHRIYTITCTRPGCECSETVKQSTESKVIPDSAVATQFRKKGWTATRKRADDTCPKCLSNGSESVTSKRVEPIAHAAKPAGLLSVMRPEERINIDAHARKTRQTKRRINAALSKVYVEDAGYIPGENDETVAKRCGCAKELVEIVRTDYYGRAERVTPTAMMRREIMAYRREIETFERLVIEQAARLESRGAAIMRWLDKMEDKTSEAPELPLEAAPPVQIPHFNGHTNGHSNGHAKAVA